MLDVWGMNTSRIHSWMGFLALIGWLSLLLFWIGCRPLVDEFETTLVVLDAHESPPDSGFVLLVNEIAYNDEGEPREWNTVGDTLRWTESTGEVVASCNKAESCSWLVCSQDPVSPGRLRTSIVPVSRRDTCFLDMHVPYRILLRLDQVSHSPKAWDIVKLEEFGRQCLLHRVEHPGGYQFRGHIVARSFPLKIDLHQSNGADAPPMTLASTEVSYQGDQTVVMVAWSNTTNTTL